LRTGENREVLQLCVRRHTSWQELESLRPVWEQILRETTGLTIFSTPEWLGAWWKAFGHAKQLTAFSFSNPGGEIVGLAPLYIESTKGSILGSLKRLLMVGDGTHDSDSLDLIFRSGYEPACSKALLMRLDSDRDWDFCELNTLPEASPVVQALQSSLKDRKWVSIQSARPNSVVYLPDHWDNYLHHLPRKFARGIERDTQNLARHYAARIFRCANEEELSVHLELLFGLHQERWKSKGQLGTFAGTERRLFYYEMSRAFLRRGWLEFWVLELNGKAAAAQFSFRYRDTVYHLQEGLDPRFLPDRVGVVLRAHILKQLINEGVRQYDFLGGIDSHKQLWRALPGAYTDLHFAKPMTRGALHLGTKQKVENMSALLRTSVPDAVLNALRWIYRQSRGRRTQP